MSRSSDNFIWPRAHAAAIMRLKTRAARRARLAAVEPAYRAWVEFYVRDWHRRCRARRAA